MLMNFMVQLQMSQGYDAIYVCVDRFRKMVHFIAKPSNITGEGMAEWHLRNVFKSHGLLEDIISDQSSQFVAKFTR